MNNPTIDGVSRELLELAMLELTDSWSWAHELRALLDAPAVERQDPVPSYEKPNSHNYYGHSNTYIDWKYSKDTSALVDHLEGVIDAVPDGPLYDAEVVGALQSTIAQLQARIAELESGRGKISIEVRECEGCNHIGIDDQHSTLGACHECDWSGPEPVDDKCPGCQRENCMSAACPDCGSRYVLVASKTIEVKPKSAVSDKYDDVLLPFLSLMRAELHANAHKGDRPGWLQMDRKTAVLEVFYHMGKLHQAVHRDEAAAIKEYAADVANMCMMLLDVCACLDATAALNGPAK